MFASIMASSDLMAFLYPLRLTLWHGPGTQLCHEDSTNDASAINNIGGWNSDHSIGRIDLASWIEEERICDLKLLAKGANILLRVGLVDSEQGKFAMSRILGVGALEERHLSGRVGMTPTRS